MATFKVGIIGAGGIARVAHGPGWQAVPDADVVAVADVDRARATAAARDLGA
ncbi:Gfo/Idh/MocA family oxidoreductase, partial [bacterium]|nr:Gfo/Idh/MocA family oxidoreductase [bacterium]